GELRKNHLRLVDPANPRSADCPRTPLPPRSHPLSKPGKPGDRRISALGHPRRRKRVGTTLGREALERSCQGPYALRNRYSKLRAGSTVLPRTPSRSMSEPTITRLGSVLRQSSFSTVRTTACGGGAWSSCAA